MFKTKFLRAAFGIVALIFISNFNLFGQVPEHELPSLKKQAIENFENGDYQSALPDFQKLMRQFPADPMYRYYSGICMERSNKDLEQAVELLYFSSARGVPPDVYFHLGEGYRKLYDFERAKKFYIQFDKEAPRSLAKEKDSKLLIRSVSTAMQITSSYNSCEVINVNFVNMNDPDQFRQIVMKGGVLSVKPDHFFSEEEDREDLNSLMFLPKTIERGQFVYFSGLERNGKNGFQIMRAKKGNTGNWTDIQPIEALNTGLNEILPYFDPVGRDIYFASDGREGLGGFDLFKSHYDEEQDRWSDPVHLGFPVNSVYDDYLLLPGTDLGMAMIFSARQTVDTALVVYRVQLSEPKQSLATATPDEIRRIANMGGAAAIALQEYEAMQTAMQNTAREEEIVTESEEPEVVEVATENRTETDSNYQKLISSALAHQAYSDSLTDLASAARVKVRDLSDPDERWTIQKQILLWEKRATEEQKQADELYSALADFTPSNDGKVVEIDTVINDITVYSYVASDSIREFAQKVFQPPVANEEPSTPSMNNSVELPKATPVKNDIAPKEPQRISESSFELLDTSPYNINNPIPIDAELPAGSFYRIQLGAYSKAVEPDAFGGLSPITGETVPERNLIKYYVGKFKSYEDAQNSLLLVRSSGFGDAYILAWYNGSIMAIEKVRKLEK